VTADVFEKDPFGAAFGDDTGDVRPEVPGIVSATAISGGAEGLAGISSEDGIEGFAKRAGVEAPQVGPDWRGGKVSGALGGDEDGARPFLPFDEGAGVVSRLGEHDAHIQASAACAEGQSVPGT
jgi:hypothetical protein